MIDMLTMPYNPRTFYYFLLGAGQRVDLVREGATRFVLGTIQDSLARALSRVRHHKGAPVSRETIEAFH